MALETIKLRKLDNLKDLACMQPLKEKVLIASIVQTEEFIVASSDGKNYLYGFYLVNMGDSRKAIDENLFDISSAIISEGKIKKVRPLDLEIYHRVACAIKPTLNDARYILFKHLLEEN